MIRNMNLDKLYDQTFFGLDTLTMLGGVKDFIEFSEFGIKRESDLEVQRTERECNDANLIEYQLDIQYQMQEEVRYRFDIILAQRIRYAALIALITTVEWVLLAVKKRVTFKFPKKSGKKNEIVYVLSVFIDYAGIDRRQEIDLLEVLIHVRNCIVHAAGLLASYKYEAELRQALARLSGIKVSNFNFLGEGIEIEAGFVDGVVEDVMCWLPEIENKLMERGLLS